MEKKLLARTFQLSLIFLSCSSLGFATNTSSSHATPSTTQIVTTPDANTTSSAADTATDAEIDSAFATSTPSSADPLIHFNRVMFKFNDILDNVIMKPIATLYNKIIPKPLNLGINNFFNNLGELPTIANDILQLHFYQMANDLWRLGVNTTLGIGGLFDVASRIDLPYYKNDFGLTLAYWGYQPSTYLVIPFFGPSSFRDGIGIPVDYFAFSIYPYVHSEALRYQLYGLGVIDRRAQLLKFQSVMEEAAVDRYVFLRDAYMQNRAYQIEENKHLSFSDKQAQRQENINT